MSFLLASHQQRNAIDKIKPNNYAPYFDCHTEEVPNGAITAFNFLSPGTTEFLAGWAKLQVYKNDLRVKSTQYTDSGASIEFTAAPSTGDVIRADIWVLNT